MNLCMALTASYIIFLAGVNQTQNKVNIAIFIAFVTLYYFILPISILELSSEKLYIDILKSLKEVSLHYVNKFYILPFLNSSKSTCVCNTKLDTKNWYSKPKMFKQHAYCCLIMKLNFV